MTRTGRILALTLPTLLALAGCGRTCCMGTPSVPELRARIGLIEQVERQRERIETLEQEVAELWWRAEQTRIDTLAWEIEQLRDMTVQERIEVLEWKLAELEGR